MLTHLSLFSGIGGIDLAAEWAGFESVGQCEWADYPTKVLEKHWPDVPRWRDIRGLTVESFYTRTNRRTVDLISGGFPCQPFSVAGNQKGKEDERYLWPEMLRVIREIKPTWVLGENVPGILSIAGDTVCQDLEREGYEVIIFNFEAASVGAKHRRERVFFVGYSKHNGLSSSAFSGINIKDARESKKRTEQAIEFERTSKSRSNEIMADTDSSNDRRYDNNREFSRETEKTEREEQRQNREWVRSRFNYGGENVVYSKSICERRLSIRENETHTRFVSSCENVNECIKNQWAIEPELGGTSYGFPCWIYLHTGGLSYEESKRAIKVLRNMWQRDEAKEIWQSIRRFNRIQQAEILFSIVCEYKKISGLLWEQLESEKAPKGTMRNLWFKLYAGSAPQGQEQGYQQEGEYTDAMCELPFKVASWEDGIPRVASGIKNRVDRLKCLGNAVVPQQVYPILKAIAEIERCS